jgi:hypothetical protein
LGKIETEYASWIYRAIFEVTHAMIVSLWHSKSGKLRTLVRV